MDLQFLILFHTFYCQYMLSKTMKVLASYSDRFTLHLFSCNCWIDFNFITFLKISFYSWKKKNISDWLFSTSMVITHGYSLTEKFWIMICLGNQQHCLFISLSNFSLNPYVIWQKIRPSSCFTCKHVTWFSEAPLRLTLILSFNWLLWLFKHHMEITWTRLQQEVWFEKVQYCHQMSSKIFHLWLHVKMQLWVIIRRLKVGFSFGTRYLACVGLIPRSILVNRYYHLNPNLLYLIFEWHV